MRGDIEQRRSGHGGLRVLDGALVAAGVIGAVLVALWVLNIVIGLALLVFKVAVVVVVVAIAVRVVHHFTRGHR